MSKQDIPWIILSMHKTINETSKQFVQLSKSNQGFFDMTKKEENIEAIKKQEIWGASKGMSQIYSLLYYSKQEHGIMNEN